MAMLQFSLIPFNLPLCVCVTEGSFPSAGRQVQTDKSMQKSNYGYYFLFGSWHLARQSCVCVLCTVPVRTHHQGRDWDWNTSQIWTRWLTLAHKISWKATAAPQQHPLYMINGVLLHHKRHLHWEEFLRKWHVLQLLSFGLHPRTTTVSTVALCASEGQGVTGMAVEMDGVFYGA